MTDCSCKTAKINSLLIFARPAPPSDNVILPVIPRRAIQAIAAAAVRWLRPVKSPPENQPAAKGLCRPRHRHPFCHPSIFLCGSTVPRSQLIQGFQLGFQVVNQVVGTELRAGCLFDQL